MEACGDGGSGCGDVQPVQRKPSLSFSPKSHFDYFSDLFVDLKQKCIPKEILIALNLSDEDEHISLIQFRRIIYENLNIDTSFMYKRVFNAIDEDKLGFLLPKQLVSLLCTLLHGPLEDQVDLAMRIYGKESSPSNFTISRQEATASVIESLQLATPRAIHTLTASSREKAHQVGEDLVSLIFPKLDADKDGEISYDELLKACEDDSSLIQVFGQFLPKTSFSNCRPLTSRLLSAPTSPRPQTALTTFEGIDYLKHSPTMRTLWGRSAKGVYKPSGRLEPIPIAKPKPKKQTNKKLSTKA